MAVTKFQLFRSVMDLKFPPLHFLLSHVATHFHTDSIVGHPRPPSCPEMLTFLPRYVGRIRSNTIGLLRVSNPHAVLFRSLATASPKTTPSALRDYQHQCIDSIVGELQKGTYHSLATSIATGGGKTVIFCSMIPRLLEIPKSSQEPSKEPQGVLILVHRKELATQAIDTLKRFHSVPHDRIYLDMAKSKLPPGIESDLRPFAIVGSVQSLNSSGCARMEQYPFNHIHTIIIDECHHAVSNSYLSVIDKIKSNSLAPPFILGFSATLSRHDKLPLNRVFQKIVFQKQIHELIGENYLCDVEWEKCNVGLNLSDIDVSPSKGGDYLLESLADHLITDDINDIVLKTYIKLTAEHPLSTKSVLVFCVNVEHMNVLKRLFNQNGINADCVSGQTPVHERESILQRFKAGEIRILFNCAVLTEGTDIPNIDCIFMLRPTLSKPLLTQMVGRGLRLHKGKTHLKIIDFVDNQSLGLTFKGSLKGKNESLLKGVGVSGSPKFNTRDISLPGEADYIKLTNLKGIKDMLESSSTNRFVEARATAAALGPLGSPPFELIRYNLWVSVLHSHAWFELSISRTGEYVLDSVSKFDTFRNGDRVMFNQRSNVITSRDHKEVTKQFRNVCQQSTVKEHTQIQAGRRIRMSSLPATDPQIKLLEGKLEAVIYKQAKPMLDVKAACNTIRRTITELNRWDASQLISHYTIGGRQVLEFWLYKNVFNTEKKRATITNSAHMDSLRLQRETGWH